MAIFLISLASSNCLHFLFLFLSDSLALAIQVLSGNIAAQGNKNSYSRSQNYSCYPSSPISKTRLPQRFNNHRTRRKYFNLHICRPLQPLRIIQKIQPDQIKILRLCTCSTIINNKIIPNHFSG